MIIKIRPFNSETDSGFIIDSMPKELYKEQFPNAKRYKKSWFEAKHAEMLGLITNSQINIACDSDNPDFLLGYSINHSNVVSFLYVKETYRKQGIAKMLASQYGFDFNSKYMTELGRQIIKQQHAKEAHMTDHETPSDTKQDSSKNIEKLIKTGFEISCVRFQSAILSAFGSAEFEINKGSGNAQRRPQEMYYTPTGIIIRQNDKWFGAPSANVIAWYL